MRVLYVSMHYKPEPCDTRTSVLAREMALRGHTSTVLTSFPNYPFGRVYDGYRQRPWKIEREEGVRTVRVPMVPDHSRSIKRRALSYLSFGLTAALIGPRLVGRPELVWVHHPPITTAFAGWLISRIKRAPFVLEVHDVWPETLMSSGMVAESWVTQAIRRACRFLYRRTAMIVVTSEGMKRMLVGHGAPAERTVVMPQWADEEALGQIALGAEPPGKFRVVYAGNVGIAQGFDTVLAAADLLSGREDIEFQIVGAGADLARLQSVPRKNVALVGQVPKWDVPRFLGGASALLLHLKRDPLFAVTVPSKLQTYLYAGRPVVCGVGGDAAEVVESARCGAVFTPEDPRSLAEAVVRLASLSADERAQMGANGRRAYEARYSVQRLVSEYETLFEQAAGGSRSNVVEPARAA